MFSRGGQKSRFLHDGAEASHLCASSQDGPEPVVSLGPITSAGTEPRVVAHAVSNSITERASHILGAIGSRSRMQTMSRKRAGATCKPSVSAGGACNQAPAPGC